MYWKSYKIQETLYIDNDASVPQMIWCFTKNTAQDLVQELAHRCDKAANHQLPTAEAFWVLQIVSMEEYSSFTQSLMEICCSTRLVILNVTATPYTCSLNGVYCPHWLVQWSHHCSHMCIPVHSSWQPGYIDVVQTVLVILTMAGIFFGQTSYSLLFSISSPPNSHPTPWSWSLLSKYFSNNLYMTLNEHLFSLE